MQILGCIKLDVLIKLVNNDRNVPIMIFCFFGYVFPGAWFLLCFCFCFVVVVLGGGALICAVINIRCVFFTFCRQ